MCAVEPRCGAGITRVSGRLPNREFFTRSEASRQKSTQRGLRWAMHQAGCLETGLDRYLARDTCLARVTCRSSSHGIHLPIRGFQIADLPFAARLTTSRYLPRTGGFTSSMLAYGPSCWCQVLECALSALCVLYSAWKTSMKLKVPEMPSGIPSEKDPCPIG